MIIGVDTGGQKTLVAAFTDDGSLVASHKFLTPKDIAEYIKQLVATINQLTSHEPPKAIAVAVPGVVRDQLAVICKNLGWVNFDLLAELKKFFPNIPMRLENDANLGAIGAANLIEPAYDKCLYIGIGTGIGSGFAVNQQLCPYLADNEVSDMIFEYDGRWQTWEEIIGGRVIAAKYGRLIEEMAEDELQEVSKRLSTGLLAILPVLRPGVVAFGGGVGAEYDKLAAHVEQHLAILPQAYHCPMIVAPHPEEIVAYGCYFYARHQFDFRKN